MECRFTFPNGKRCRCRATPSHVFCRQHAPQAHLPRPRPLQPRSTGAGTSFRNWRDLERNLITLEPEELAAEAAYILDALLIDGPHGISDTNAGRLLRALLRRLGIVPFRLLDDPTPPQINGYPVDPEAFERMLSLLDRYAPVLPPYEFMDETSEFPDEIADQDWNESGDNQRYPYPNPSRINTRPALLPPPGGIGRVTPR